MKLTVLERIVLPMILPKEGDYLTLKTAAEAQKEIALTDDEMDEVELRVGEKGQLQWNPEKAKEKEVKITARATVMIEEALKKLDDEKKLTPDHMTLFEKFVEAKGESKDE
jgi:hypothetical protein